MLEKLSALGKVRTNYNPHIHCFQSNIKDLEVKRGNYLYSISGVGISPEEALVDLFNKAKDEIIITNAFSSDRKEYYWHPEREEFLLVKEWKEN